MGISGLLPALKSIQVTRHLSEYSGKTIAVDAYVWLHKGVYSCATDIATGKNTHKYVDYAMHRVRLLRHHKIEPYVVFDGGPLPAKKGTESERKQKREENLARGKAFIAQGKHSQARDCFIKCVDVTPQMAFQLIKALRAESVPYVVAPYEADAQLAYLERTGVVDAILTEDSDLLVFGCQNVLFKLDSVASTVVSISRKDFGSVAASSSDTNGISLIGWSDVQFRSMAILSGCDYLPSIPGVGLKTACTLLKKWRTAEQVIKTLAIEGKKYVPSGYLKQFKLAEKCFLHQRVYCPKAEKLVHLSVVDADWIQEFDTYVGSDMDPTLAKNVALGDYDPVTHLPMKDINPSFLPRTLKPRQPATNSPSKISKGKGKMRQSLPSPTKPSAGILSFFGPNPIIPPRTNQKPIPMVAKHVSGLTGKASGKRSLAEVMDQDMERRKKHRKSHSPAKPTSSKFFYTHPEIRASSVQRRHSDGVIPIAGPSRLRTQSADKENVCLLVDDNDEEMVETSEPELDGSELSQKAQFGKDKDADAQLEMDLNFDDFPDVVEQEDGYISPSPSRSKDAQDLSSPPGRRPWKGDPNREMAPTGMIPSDDEDDDADFGADAISSPISVKKPQPHSRQRAYQTPMRWLGSQDADGGTILVQPTPTPKKGHGLYPDLDDVPSPTLYRGPDLRNLLGDNGPTELDYQNEEVEAKRPGVSGTTSGSTSPPSPSPETPDIGEQPIVDVIDVDEFDFNLDEEETRQAQKITANAKAVMNGWREKWAMPYKKPVPVRGSGSFPPLNSPPRHFIRPLSPKKARVFTSGSRPAHAFNLKRSNANVTPAGRHSVVSYHPPRSAPSKLPATSTILNGVGVKSAGKLRRSLFAEETTATAAGTPLQVRRAREIVDLTTHDVNDEDDIVAPRRPNSAMTPRQMEQEILSSSQMRLSHFR